MIGFQVEPLGDMVGVGATTADSVRLWLRLVEPGRHRIELWVEGGETMSTVADLDGPPAADNTASVCWPGDLPEAAPLRPLTAYRYRVTRVRTGELVGEGRFETAPAAPDQGPERFAFGVVSCHQPFSDDGALAPEAMRGLRVAEQVFTDERVKAVFLVGDQVYSDYPKALSLFDDAYFRAAGPSDRATILDCTRQQVRALFHQRYRVFWAVPELRRILANWPCYPILDDHELIDNFGTAPEHATERWRELRAGALDAYHDYQGLFTRGRAAPRPEVFHFEVEYGPTAVFVADLRSQRRHDGTHLEILGDGQFAALDRFFRAHRGKDALMLVLSVPLMHVPDWVASVGKGLLGEDSDAADRWSNAAASQCRHRLVQLLHDHQRANPRQRIVILSGDIHVGAMTEFHWRDRDVRPLFQLASSAISNQEMPLIRQLNKLLPGMNIDVKGLEADLWADAQVMEGIEGASVNPVTDLNLGIVQVSRGQAGTELRLKLYTPSDDDPPRPRLVFCSRGL